MRYIISTLLSFLFLCSFIKAQDCPPGDVTLYTQAQVDAFVANYPNCTTINGHLRIGDNVSEADAVTDISGLSILTHITGDLRISEVFHLSSLTGLEQLEAIGGDLRFNFLWGNALLDISALDHPITIGGIVYFGDVGENNITPCNVQAICDHYFLSQNNVVSIYGTCTSLSLTCQPIGDCPNGNVLINSQEDMDYFAANFPNCTQINGYWRIDSGDPYNNTVINVPELPALEHITGNVSIGTRTILSANSFSALTQVGGGVYLSAEIEGDFPVLESIGGSIIVFDGSNTGAGPTGGYPALKYIGGGISAGGAEGGFLNSNDFPLLERIEGSISGCGWGSSHNFSGFDNLRYIGGDINTQDGTISGMNMLDTIGGNINFYTCYAAGVSVRITGLNQLKYIGGDFRLSGVSYICAEDLSGLSQLEYIGGDFEFYWQYEGSGGGDGCWNGMDNMNVLQQLIHVGGKLRIGESGLSNLDFLNALENVGGNLEIRYNDLQSIEGLNHAIDIGGELMIEGNSDLAECAVQAVCEHLGNSGDTTIANNMIGCNTTQEVLDDCSIVQECPPGDVTITCQDELDAFEAQYPNCTQINGNFTLMDDEYNCFSLTDPNFPALERITGNLRVWTYLSADAFPNLRYVGGGIGTDDEFGGTFAVLDTVMGSVSMDNSYQGVSFPNCPQLKYIGGNLGIYTDEGGSLDSHDFPALEYIGGNLYDYSNWTDSDFSGFTSLRYIGGDIDIEEGEIDGFNALDTIGGDLILREYEFDFSALKVNITGLNQLKYIGGDFALTNIYNTHCVEDLSGLSQLNYIGGNFEYIWQYGWDGGYGCANPLTTLNGLQQLKQVGGNLIIDGNSLLDLDFLVQLENVGGNLQIRGNGLESIEGLNHMVAIGGELIIENNPDLSECAVQSVCNHINNGGTAAIANNLTGCNSIFEVQAACDPMLICPSGDITLTTQEEINNLFATYSNCTELPGRLTISATDPADITNLDALSQLTSIGNGLVIDNTSITNLNGLQNLTTTGYNLVITNNPNLTSLMGLENITSTSSHLKIENNDALTDLSGLNNITQIGEGLLVFDNDNLQTLTGLDVLTSIGSQLYLKGNTSLNSLFGLQGSPFGLENLTSIGTDIRIQNNSSLTSLNALSNVTTINGYIRITANDALTSLMGLENINPDGITEVLITNNPNLSMCSASSICGHIEDDGMTTFSNNAAGCNSLSEVTDICIVSTDTPYNAFNISIFPNPNNGIFTIQSIENATYNIRNLTGQIIQSGELKNDTSIDISDEVQGVYFISLSIDNHIFTKRIMKM